MREKKTGETGSRASNGGSIRFAQMSPADRSELGLKAVLTRWAKPRPDIRRAEFKGTIRVGETSIGCALLDDGTRVVVDRDLALAFGRKKQMRRRTDESGVKLPSYLSASPLKRFVTAAVLSELSTTTIVRAPNRSTILARPAQILQTTCQCWLDAKAEGKLSSQQAPIATFAVEMMATIEAAGGISALVDKATGYDMVVVREAVVQSLEGKIDADFLPWLRRFPSDLFREFFRVSEILYSSERVSEALNLDDLIQQFIISRLSEVALKEIKRSASSVDKRPRPLAAFSLDTGDRDLDIAIAELAVVLRISKTRDSLKANLKAAFPDVDEWRFPEPEAKEPQLIDLDFTPDDFD